MAYVNVVEWSPDRVSEWLKGLDDVIVPYIHYFVNNQVDGKRLLQLTPDELPSLHVTKIGHQEIILQGIELLKNIHYQLHQENVQYLALRLSSKARSIYNELRIVTSSSRHGCGSAGEDDEGNEDEDDHMDGNDESSQKKQERVSTAVIAGVADVLSSVKGLVSWLNRQPFVGVEMYDILKNSLVDMSIRLATIAQRDMFAENQATVIQQSCLKLAQMSDKIIQEYSDPLIIQPASLDIATIKKKADDEWGVLLQGSYHGIHQVSGVRNLSPAHQCGRLEEGDELVQVNYQTVVGWSPHKVLAVMQESPVEVILTIKKRPRHANTVTQIYFKPFRLPSKKRTYSPWGSSVDTSARYDLQSIPNLQLSVSVPIKLKVESEPRPKSSTPPPVVATPSPQNLSSVSDRPNTTSGSDSGSDLEDDAFLSDSDMCGTSPTSVRLYQTKPRAPVQRRATIPGATTRPTFSFDQLLQDVRWNRGVLRGFPESSMPSDPDLLRSPYGNDYRIIRPHTCIGTEDKTVLDRDNSKNVAKEDKSCNDDALRDEEIPKDFSDDKDKQKDQGVAVETKNEERKIVNVIPLPPRKPTCPPYSSSTQDQNKHATVISDKATSGKISLISSKGQPPLPPASSQDSSRLEKHGSDASVEAVQKLRRSLEERPKLDKSHSTPAYDLDGDGSVPIIFPSTITESSPGGHSSPTPSSSSSASTTSTFFSSYDPKHALSEYAVHLNVASHEGLVLILVCAGKTHCGLHCTLVLRLANETSGGVAQPGSISVRDISKEDPLSKTESHALSPPLNVSHDNSDGVRKHFKSQVIIPLSTPISTVTHQRVGISVTCSIKAGAVENTPELTRSDRTSADDKALHGGICGDGCRNSKHCSSVSCSVEKMKMSSTQHLPDSGTSASHLSPISSSTVVLRDTRSSSPSVWRRGLLVTERGSRRISCRDLGQGDHQGWLYRRRDNKGFLLPHRWERRWFILKKNSLYGYRDREAVKADSLVYLPGFHVCPANDVKSKKYAFKIYHSSGATFYFACDTSEERSRWMSQMGLSTISSSTHQRQQYTQHQNQWDDVYYSETDDELEDRTSPSRLSPQSNQSRVSPNRENVNSLWRGNSVSPLRGSQSRGPQLTSLSGARNQALRFLQHGKDIEQPMPTASFRSYRRVSETTSTGDIRGAVRLEISKAAPTEERGTRTAVTRKNSLRDRLKQLPVSFTLERRKQVSSRSTPAQREQQKSISTSKSTDALTPTYNITEAKQIDEISQPNFGEDGHFNFKNKQSLSDFDNSIGGPVTRENVTITNIQRPHYMLPTCASSLHSPVKPSPFELEKSSSVNRIGNGSFYGSPPSSGRCSPSKLEHGGRRGSIGRESPLRSKSPRRGSLDCLASSHPRAMSPPTSPFGSLKCSSHGSASSLLASEEYREGSPEKLWISSLRADTSKPRVTVRTSPEKKESRSKSHGDVPSSDRVKRTALYHPPQLKSCSESMKAAFELSLDPSASNEQITNEKIDRIQINVPGQEFPESSENQIRLRQGRDTVNRATGFKSHSVSRPEVPPRTKFLSPSERTLPFSGSTPVITSRSSSLSPSSSNVSIISTKSTSSLPGVLSAFHMRPSTSPSPVHDDSSVYGMTRSSPKPLPNLSIPTLPEESEVVRTPLKVRKLP
ncbi:Connector enhancer of kinase suppressor of ras [Halocaridina rubra]|uniref:Connector enhancer of kinase suppressor of ras n=1 Tax=Halocaridina rubra TaxID=373956 RepID=A0AAN8X0M9_HALRR